MKISISDSVTADEHRSNSLSFIVPQGYHLPHRRAMQILSEPAFAAQQITPIRDDRLSGLLGFC
jgi:hypothetical protein